MRWWAPPAGDGRGLAQTAGAIRVHPHCHVAACRPAARSHSLSRSYRAVLPTSLGRVRPSPEVVRLGDLLRFSVRSLAACAPFQGAAGRARCPVPCRFEGRALPRRGGGSSRCDVRARWPAAWVLHWRRRLAGRRNVCRRPFRRLRGVSRALRTGSPRGCCRGPGNLLHLGGASCTVATPTEIWTSARSRRPHGHRSCRALPRPTWRVPAPCGSRAAARSIFRALRFGR